MGVSEGIVPGVVSSPVLATAEPADVPVVLFWLPSLLNLAGDFEERLAALCSDFDDIAQVWNVAIDSADSSGHDASIDESRAATGYNQEEEDDVVPGICPLQKITVQRMLRGQLAARKALTHLWDSIARARRDFQWGTLHKRCPCLVLRDTCCLVLCDAEGRDAEFADKTWQRNFAAGAITLAEAAAKTTPK